MPVILIGFIAARFRLPLVFALALTWIPLFAGCAHRPVPARERAFAFEADTLAYPNELVWEYSFDPETGRATHTRRTPPATYSHHCFVVARVARQFFEQARFAPELPRLTAEQYRERIREVIGRSSRSSSASQEPVVFPGYAHLNAFSADFEDAFKEESGGAWRSYLQRGHWRIMWPFTRGHQDRMAQQLIASLAERHPPVVHLTTFPNLTMNHALLLTSAERTGQGWRFDSYDPNTPEAPRELLYDAGRRQFFYGETAYFRGGRVNVYQIYHAWNY